MSKFFRTFISDERGVSAMEYAVLAGIIVVALGAAGWAFQNQIDYMFYTMFNAIRDNQSR